MQKVDTAGQLQWGTSGISCTETSSYSAEAVLSTDLEDGIIVTWMVLLSDELYDIYAQRLDASGNFLWGNSGVPVTTMAGFQGQQEILPVANSGAIISFIDFGDDGETHGLYLQRICADGSLGNCPLATNGFTFNSEIIVSPNPNHGNFRITAPMTIDEITITDILGKQIFHSTANETTANVQLNNAVSGIYFVKILSDGKDIVKKMIVN